MVDALLGATTAGSSIAGALLLRDRRPQVGAWLVFLAPALALVAHAVSTVHGSSEAPSVSAEPDVWWRSQLQLYLVATESGWALRGAAGAWLLAPLLSLGGPLRSLLRPAGVGMVVGVAGTAAGLLVHMHPGTSLADPELWGIASESTWLAVAVGIAIAGVEATRVADPASVRDRTVLVCSTLGVVASLLGAWILQARAHPALAGFWELPPEELEGHGAVQWPVHALAGLLLLAWSAAALRLARRLREAGNLRLQLPTLAAVAAIVVSLGVWRSGVRPLLSVVLYEELRAAAGGVDTLPSVNSWDVEFLRPVGDCLVVDHGASPQVIVGSGDPQAPFESCHEVLVLSEAELPAARLASHTWPTSLEVLVVVRYDDDEIPASSRYGAVPFGTTTFAAFSALADWFHEPHRRASSEFLLGWMNEHATHVRELEHGVRWAQSGQVRELVDLAAAVAEIQRLTRAGAIEALVLEPGPRWTVQDAVTLCRAWLDTIPAYTRSQVCALSLPPAEDW